MLMSRRCSRILRDSLSPWASATEPDKIETEINMKTMRYIAYIRRSSDRSDKQTLSIDAQIRELKRIAERDGINVVDYVVESQSAYKPGRPIFAEMIERIKRGEAEGIFVWHISRLSRNPVDGGMLVWLMDEGMVKEIRTPERTYRNNGDDKFFMAIEFGMSKKSSDDTSAFVKRDMGSKLGLGEWVGMVPVGYLNMTPKFAIAGKMFELEKQTLLESSGRQLKRIEIDPILGPLMRNFFDWYLTAPRTLRESAAYMNKLNIKSPRFKDPYGTSMVERILRNPFYAGQMLYKGELFKGIHDPIITVNEFEGIQNFLKGNAHPQHTKHEFTFSKLAKCGGCGYSIVGTRKRKPSGKQYEYYTCSRRGGEPCTQHPMTGGRVEEIVQERFRQVRIDEEVWRLCKQIAELYFSEQIRKEDQAKEHVERQMKIVDKKLEGILDMHLNELLTKDEFLEKKNTLMNEKARLEQARQTVRPGDKHWLLETQEFFDKAHYAYDLFLDPNTTTEKKKSLIRSIGWNLQILNENISWNFKKPFNIIAERNVQKQAVGTPEFGEDKKKNTSSDDEVPFWRTGRDSNPRSSP